MAQAKTSIHLSPLACNVAARERIAADAKRGTLSHAILISGPKGSGKHTLAKLICAAENCENKQKGAVPCLACNRCRRVMNGNFPDVKTLKKAAGKATVGVEELRLFREDMFLSPTEAESKFYVIEEADDLTVAAQNALLKVLEEPPRSVHIILLTDSVEKILTTVRSRAQLIRMERLSEEDISEYLLKNLPEAAEQKRRSEERYAELLLLADGRIGKAKEYLDARLFDEREEERKLVRDVIAALPKRVPFEALYKAIFALPQKRDDLSDALEQILVALRDMILSATCSGVRPLFFSSEEEVRNAVSSLPEKRLYTIFRIVEDAIENNQKNVMIPTLLSDMAASIRTS